MLSEFSENIGIEHYCMYKLLEFKQVFFSSIKINFKMGSKRQKAKFSFIKNFQLNRKAILTQNLLHLDEFLD